MAKDKMEKGLIGGMMAIMVVAVLAQFVQALTPQPPQPQYTCFCGATFSTQAELDEHMRTAHPSPLGYQCPYCPESFTTLDELVSHVASEHPDKPPIQPIDIIWE